MGNHDGFNVPRQKKSNAGNGFHRKISYSVIFFSSTDLAMTGEITLRGIVLPVGGVKEKVIAAYRSGFKKIIIPQMNKKDLKDLPSHIRENMDFVLVSSIEEVVENAFDFSLEDLIPKLSKL